MLPRLPAILAALCLTIYWGAVLIKLIKLAKKIGKDPNALPREPIGILMRLLWYPAIFAMLIAAWLAALPIHVSSLLAYWTQPLVPQDSLFLFLACPAALTATLVTALTFVCWRKMGRSWRIGIDPSETTEMVSAGPFRYVRHPIYALRMILGPAVILALPSPLILLTVCIDLLLLQIEARREEAYMLATHGQSYKDYQLRTGRFLPKARLG